MKANAPQYSALFRPVEDGYVFRLPYQTGLGKVRHYLVDETQKRELTDIMAGPHPYRTLIGLGCAAVAAVVIAALIVYTLSPHEKPQDTDTLAMIVVSGLLILPGYLAWRVFKLKQLVPVLMRAQPTKLTITRSEMRTRVLSSMSTGVLSFCALCFAFLAATNITETVFDVSAGHAKFRVVVSAAIFLALSIYYATELAGRIIRRMREAG